VSTDTLLKLFQALLSGAGHFLGQARKSPVFRFGLNSAQSSNQVQEQVKNRPKTT